MFIKLADISTLSMSECEVLLEFMDLPLAQKVAISERMYQLQMSETEADHDV